MSLVKRAIRSFFIRIVGKVRIENIIVRLADWLNIDLLYATYKNLGILNYETMVETGEHFLISQVLPCLISPKSPTLFDVGANVGHISAALKRTFNHAEIWAFEPNPVTYSQLVQNLQDINVKCQRIGLGAKEDTCLLYCYSRDQMSGHASMYRHVFDLYRNYGVKGFDQIEAFECNIATIDSFCLANSIEQIHFLKIDVEGHELEVLRGATTNLKAGNVSVVQFEFNECNVTSRVFLKDFYDLLPNHCFYRLNKSALIPLRKYSARNEIFQFQNIIAVRSDLEARILQFIHDGFT